LHRVLFSHPQSLVFSVLSTEPLYILTSEQVHTSIFNLTFTHSIVGRNISCYCMSCSHHLSLVTPQVVPPLNLTTHLTNYLLLRSFQLNFSKDALTHIPVYRPAFNNTLVAGDHYFEFRVPGIPYPVISVTFYCSPNITIPLPLTTTCSGIRARQEIHCFFHSIPRYIPAAVDEHILAYSASSGHNLIPLCIALDSFFESFHRPISPPSSPIQQHTPPY
jgi:hypothetical protein